PQPLAYPDWAFAHPELANRPVWVETITYVGVIGGSGYDYLAYVSYLRDKNWGQAGRAIATAPELATAAQDHSHINRRWLRAVAGSFDPEYARRHAPTLRKIAVSWSGFGGFIVLAWTFFFHLARGTDTPPGLIALLTPANLFTGVLACGFICLLTTWTDWKFLPPALRAGNVLTALNAVAVGIVLVLGINGYWDYSVWPGFLILAGTLAAG